MSEKNDYNTGFHNALQFASKHLFVAKSIAKLQTEIREICFWLDDNPDLSRDKVLVELTRRLRKHAVYPRE